MLAIIILLFVVTLLFDVSINLRRLNKNLVDFVNKKS